MTGPKVEAKAVQTEIRQDDNALALKEAPGGRESHFPRIAFMTDATEKVHEVTGRVLRAAFPIDYDKQAEVLSDQVDSIKQAYHDGRAKNHKTTNPLTAERAIAEEKTTREALDAIKMQDAEREKIMKGLERQMKDVAVPSRDKFLEKQVNEGASFEKDQQATFKLAETKHNELVEAIQKNDKLSPAEKRFKLAEEAVRDRELKEQLNRNYQDEKRSFEDQQVKAVQEFEKKYSAAQAKREGILRKMEQIFREGQEAKEYYGKILYGDGLDCGTAKARVDFTTKLLSKDRKDADRDLRIERDEFSRDQDRAKAAFKERMANLRQAA